MRPITLTTDFGQTDGYVGVIKGVILSIAAQAQIVDVSHEVEPWDIASAAWIIKNSYRFFPPESIHVVVVDPGVGGSRRSILLTGPEGTFVGPDNGVFSYICRQCPALQTFELTNEQFWRPQVSGTFHARDIYAPVAAHLCKGVEPRQLGHQIDITSLVQLPEPKLILTEDKIEGEVVYIDRFGNLITNIPAKKVRPDAICIACGIPVGRLKTTYSSAKEAEPAAIAGSHGYLEIGLNRGRASKFFSCEIGKPVVVQNR